MANVWMENGGLDVCTLNATAVSFEYGSYEYNEDLSEDTPALVYTNDLTKSTGGDISLTVYQICDEEATYVTMEPLVMTTGTYISSIYNTYETAMTSKQGCPIFTYNALVQFVAANKYLWGSLFIISGIFLAVLGRKLFKPSLFIISMMIFSGFVLIIF